MRGAAADVEPRGLAMVDESIVGASHWGAQMANDRPGLVWAAFSLLILAACSDKPWSAVGNESHATLTADAAGASVVPRAGEPDLPPCTHVLSQAEAASRDGALDAPVVNRLDVKASGRLNWNDAEIDATQLRQYLGLVSQMTPTPMLIVSFETDAKTPVRREIADAVTASFHCRPEGI